MNTIKLAYLFIITSCLIINQSCKKDDNEEGECIGSGGTSNQIKSYDGANGLICFNYDDQNRLQSWGGNTLIYDSNSNIIRWDLEFEGEIETIRMYNYDSQDRLVNYSDYYIDVVLTYSDNLVTISGTFPSGYPIAQSLELNEQGLVSKLINHEGGTYSYMYDENENMVLLHYQDGNYFFETEYFYDNNPNPFFGLFSSIYLERFIDSEGKIVGITGHNYPYLKNNFVATEDYNLAEYEYNAHNYPIYIKYDHTIEGCCYEYYLTY